jgi:hypothetical protein
MTLQKAAQIESALIAILNNAQHGNSKNFKYTDIFIPHSRIGANATREVFQAVRLCIAQLYRNITLDCNILRARNKFPESLIKEKWILFDNYVDYAANILDSRIYICCIPDRELADLKSAEQLEDDPGYGEKLERVKSLNASEESGLESIASFVGFLKTQDPTSIVYYDKVYDRLNIPRPKVELPQSNTQGCATLFAAAFALLCAVLIVTIL